MSNNYEELAERAKTVNQQVIEEFHANGGEVRNLPNLPPGVRFLLLHTLGAKSKLERITPLQYFKDGDTYVLIAAKGGAPTNPDWYYNILAHPDDVTVEVGTESFNVHATVAQRTERDRLFADIARHIPGFAKMQQGTSRLMPIVLLERVNTRE